MKKLFVLILTVMMIVSSFILTGCTDNDNNTTTSTTQKTEPENVAVTKTVTSYEVDPMTLEVGENIEREITYKGVIKIGNTNSTTGDYSVTAGAFNDGLEAYINMVNFNGGVGGDYEKGEQGYFIEFINYDDGNRAEDGIKYTKKLVEEDNVFAVVGQFSEYTVDATLDYIKQTGTIFFGPACGNGKMFSVEADSAKNGATIFPVRPITTAEGQYIVKSIYDLYPDFKKVGIIFSNDGEGVGVRDGVKYGLERMIMGDNCVVIETENGKFDVAEVSDCDVVVVAAGRTNAEQIFKTLADVKIGKPVFALGNVLLSRSVAESEFYEKYDELDDADKFPIYLTNWFDVADLEGYFECILDIAKTGGEVKHLTNRYAIEGWIVADVFFEGLRRMVQDGSDFNSYDFSDDFIKAMGWGDIILKMAQEPLDDVFFDTRLYYGDGFRTGTLTIGLMDLDFEQVIALKDITPRVP